MRKYIEVVKTESYKAVLRIDVTGRTESMIRRIERGILPIEIEEDYFTQEITSYTELPIGTIPSNPT